ncbi:MAG: glycosyltransferase family 4 protein [Planctomycetota bacterium]
MPDRLPRIVVDLEKLRHINCGLGRFSLHFGRELLRLSAGRFEPVFFLSPGAERHFPAGGFESLPVRPWRKEALLRHLRPVMGPLVRPGRVDLWHVTNQLSKYLPPDGRVPVLLTIHDLAFLHEQPDWQADPSSRPRMRRKLADVQRKIDRAVAIVTDTAYVAEHVRHSLDVGRRPMHVVPLGLSHPPAAAVDRPAFVPDGPFLLTVGNCLPHKNFAVLFDLVSRLPGRRLVIAGKKATPYGDHLAREVAARGLEHSVILAGEVCDADRQWLYEHCEAFVFPSLSEGFGFPVLEALAAGRPVFISNTTCLPEIAGPHAFAFESFDADAMAAAYESGLATWRADPAAVDRGRRHAASFAWSETARGYVRVYESILAAARG